MYCYRDFSLLLFCMLPKWHILRECKAKENIQETTLTRKMGYIYISCMWMSCIVDRLLFDTYLLMSLGPQELKHLPLPKSVKFL